MNYTELYEEYHKTHKTGGKYIRKFVQFADRQKITLENLDNFHEEWKHQLSRGFHGSTVYNYRWQCRKFIDYLKDCEKMKCHKERRVFIRDR